MIGKTLLVSSLAVAGVVASDPAPVINNNPAGANYLARFDGKQHGIRGNIDLASAPDGQGVVVNVDLDSLPAQNMGGPFLYHIHEFRVPEDGNCTATGGHLDPQGRGEMPPCDASNPASCQEGDLAGKHGKITASPAFTAHYTDKYVSLIPGTAAFAGNRSIVIHDANTTRIACANLYTASAGYGSSSNSTANSTSTAASPSGTSNSGSGSGSSGSGSGSGSSGSSATATPPKPSSSVTASGASHGMTAAGSAMMLAALAFLL